MTATNRPIKPLLIYDHDTVCKVLEIATWQQWATWNRDGDELRDDCDDDEHLHESKILGVALLQLLLVEFQVTQHNYASKWIAKMSAHPVCTFLFASQIVPNEIVVEFWAVWTRCSSCKQVCMVALL